MEFITWILNLFKKQRRRSMKHIILFGPPGSGKGTQAIKLAEEFNLIHISTGDLFRFEISNETPLGLQAKSFMDQGQLVPDAVTIGMLKNKVEKHPEADGFIYDGFPRTIPQAEALNNFLNSRDEGLSGLIALEVDDDEIVKRLLQRGETSGRSDDQNEEVIRNRIQVYKNQTYPVYDFYKQSDKSQVVNGIGSIEEIFNRLSAAINQM